MELFGDLNGDRNISLGLYSSIDWVVAGGEDRFILFVGIRFQTLKSVGIIFH